jgi:hypothetical protein
LYDECNISRNMISSTNLIVCSLKFPFPLLPLGFQEGFERIDKLVEDQHLSFLYVRKFRKC